MYLRADNMSKTCCGFGHRDVFQNIEETLDLFIEKAISKGCTLFYTGAMGDFDSIFSSAVRKAKHKHPRLDIKLICVKPYLTKELNDNKEYYYAMYDDIIIPTELADVHFKSIITKRNEWIIDNSDIVIIYTVRDYGGAYNSLKYAKRRSKTIYTI